MSHFSSMFRLIAIVSTVAAVAAFAVPAEAKAKRKMYHHQAYSGEVYRAYGPGSVPVGGGNSANTYARAPRSYGGDPADYRNVPVGRPEAAQQVNGCYGGREQVLSGGRLIWVPDVTCPYSADWY